MKIINSILILGNTLSASEIVNYNSIRNLQRLFDKETAQLRKSFSFFHNNFQSVKIYPICSVTVKSKNLQSELQELAQNKNDEKSFKRLELIKSERDKDSNFLLKYPINQIKLIRRFHGYWRTYWYLYDNSL